MPVPRTEPTPTGRWRGVATIDGRRRTRHFDTEGQALVWADTEMRHAAAAVMAGRPSPEAAAAVTLAQYVPVFLASRLLEPATVSNYRSHLKSAVEEFGDWSLEAITHPDIARWVAEMGRRRGRTRVELGTIGARLKILRMLFAEAIRSGLVTKDPTADIRLPKSPTKPFRVIDAAEEPTLLAASEDAGLLVPVLLAMDAGLRWAEVYGLHAANVDLARRRLDVSDVLARPDFEPRPYPKGKLTRTVPMTARLCAAVQAYLSEPPSTGGPVRCPDARCRHGLLLFSSTARNPVNYHQWKGAFLGAIAAAGLRAPQPTFHKLRHTFGTRLAEVGTPPEEIAELMGHASTETTRMYTHAAGPRTSEAWLRFALEGAPSPVAGILQRRAG